MIGVAEQMRQRKLTALTVQEGLLLHTRYFFKQTNGRKFVTSDHHRQICALLDRIVSGEVVKAMINISPRYGKTELAVKNFAAHGLSLNPAAKFIHLSYSDDLALDNSEAIKEQVGHESYQALFPEIKIKPDSRAKKKWYTTAGGGVYATSTAGQVTGFGAGQVDEEADDFADELEAELDELTQARGMSRKFGGALIIDDPIKPEDADAELRRERINARYDSTIKNRVNSRHTPIIIIMQRVHENDLCGYLLKNEPGEWTVLSLPAIQTDAEGNEYALWPFKHTLEELKKLQAQNPTVFGRQYMQDPQPATGFLYSSFRTYETLPQLPATVRRSYADTADTGKDFLCHIVYDETATAMYVIDVQYTQAPMEETEPEAANLIQRTATQKVKIESNNGGRGFARNVEALLRDMGNTRTKVEWFHQSGNKEARLFTNSATVTNLIYMPAGWATRWPLFYKHVTGYLAAGKNAFDDAPDCLTGMVEAFQKPKAREIQSY